MKPDEGTCVFGADVLEKYLEDMLQEVDGVREASDIEYIHRMRVATRRLRAALPLFERCFPKKKFPGWVDQIKQMTRALGKARDLDVQLELVHDFEGKHNTDEYRPGLRRLQLRLHQKRNKAQGKVNQALTNLVEGDTSGQIEKRLEPYLEKQEQVYLYTPALYQLGYESIQAKLFDFLSYESFISQPEKVAELHAMRIAAKRLRYTMEIFAPLYPGELKDPIQASRKAQDLLGEIHDADVWLVFLPQFIDDERERTLDYLGHLKSFHRLIPGLTCFLEDRQALREKKYQEFLVFWEKHKAPGQESGAQVYPEDISEDGESDKTATRRNGGKQKGTWQALLQIIQIPYYQGEQPVSLEEVEPESSGEDSAG